MQIIDTHFHIWDLDAHYYPWLTDRITPRSFGDYADLRRSYLIDDFRADIGDLDVVGAVHVQAEYDPADPVAETRWIQEVSDRNGGFPQGIVVFADLGAADAEATLDAHCAYPGVRGVRQLIHQYRFDPDIRYPLENPEWRANFGLLRKFGLCFDLNLYARDMPDAAAFVREHSDTQFIVGHMGMPARNAEDPDLENWHRNIALLAEAPNVAVKVSGFGIADKHWTIKAMRPVLDRLVESFGTDRIVFGSNYPVERLSGSYRTFWNACFALTRDFSDTERAAMFHDNARRLYRL